MRPFLLPVFFYAGQVNAAAETPGLSDAQEVALRELRSLLVWALLQLNILTEAQVNLESSSEHPRRVFWRSCAPCWCGRCCSSTCPTEIVVNNARRRR